MMLIGFFVGLTIGINIGFYFACRAVKKLIDDGVLVKRTQQ